MTETWKLDDEFYAIYSEDRNVWISIQRYHKKRNWVEMAQYFFQNGKLKGKQFRLPNDRNNREIAKRLCNK
ncbi:hypothetical protein P9E34_19585 [Schinkia azotoformans]|uniref:hypothetical protein n=1 Tax=Schinkia azotoformans TaxID=1454 RepID=UPI002DB5FA58|nr:hypothetical protein [Schinkia azotoformans]MEC1726914.1 hypothetical protein [Schinkia azotoformans]